MAVDAIQLTECAELLEALPAPLHLPEPQTMERLGQAHGAVLYRTQLPAGAAGTLLIDEAA